MQIALPPGQKAGAVVVLRLVRPASADRDRRRRPVAATAPAASLATVPGQGRVIAPVDRGAGSVRAIGKVMGRRAATAVLATGPVGSGGIVSARQAAAPNPRPAPIPAAAEPPPSRGPSARRKDATGPPTPAMLARRVLPHASNRVPRRTGGSQEASAPHAETTRGHPVRGGVRPADTAAQTGRFVAPMTLTGGVAGPRRAPVAGARTRHRTFKAAARATGAPTARRATGPTAVGVPTAAAPLGLAVGVPTAAAPLGLAAVDSPTPGGPPGPVAPQGLVALPGPAASTKAAAPQHPAVTGATDAPRTAPLEAAAIGTRRTTNRPEARVRPAVPRSRSHREPIPSCWTPRSARSCARSASSPQSSSARTWWPQAS